MNKLCNLCSKMNIYLSKIKLDIYKGLRSNKTIGWTLEGYTHKHKNNDYCLACNNRYCLGPEPPKGNKALKKVKYIREKYPLLKTQEYKY